MNIRFKKQQARSLTETLSNYNNLGFKSELEGDNIWYKYLPVDIETYETIRGLQNDQVLIEGFPAYIRMGKIGYETMLVPVGVTGSEILDEGTPTGVQKTWEVWQPNITMERNDNIEVIFPTTYESQAATSIDFLLLENTVAVVEIFGTDELRADWMNNADWIDTTPIVKTATYYTRTWEVEEFDFVQAQKLVALWFEALVGITETDKFNSLDYLEKIETIRWGVLSDNSEGKGLIEATIDSKTARATYHMWNKRRAGVARSRRFESAFVYLEDNFEISAIENKLPAMLLTNMKDFYTRHGNSTNPNHLLVNHEINPTFWATFVPSDVGYSDITLAEVKVEVEKILDGNKYDSIRIS